LQHKQMSGAAPILELLEALPDPVESCLPPVPIDLRIMPGEFALIEADDRVLAAEFADLCCGLLKLRKGSVRFLGRDWATAAAEMAAAMRGRIGRVYGPESWIGSLSTDANILWPQLHHTRRSEAALRETAAEVSRRFGLPGLPLGRPVALSDADLLRASCVRAFVGEPQLVILDNEELEEIADLRSALLNAVMAMRHRHAACLWLTEGRQIWQDRSCPATIRLRLSERGLVQAGSVS
jgi:phospholipid/cholesterol/gamma-HCH transport system ATP-binding protein